MYCLCSLVNLVIIKQAVFILGLIVATRAMIFSQCVLLWPQPSTKKRGESEGH